MANPRIGEKDPFNDSRVWNGFEFVKGEWDPINDVIVADEPQMWPTQKMLEEELVKNQLVPPVVWEGEAVGLSSYTSEMLIASLLTRIESPVEGLREGLQETPGRVVKAFKHWFGGYGMDPAALLKVFEDGAEDYDQMIVVKNIPIYSKCEHHMADIFGTATIAYIPNGKIVGLSKLSRLADGFARRLQVQERLTSQIANALNDHLEPKGVGVMIKARHMCMESRGICQQGHHTITTSLKGVLLTEPSTRAEFMALAD